MGAVQMMATGVAAIADRDTDRREWLAWRRRGLGGSDAAAIAGVDPYKTPMHVWLDKTGQLPLDDEMGEAALWGTLLEPVIADEFQRRTDLWIRERQAQVVHPEIEWLRATLDGQVWESQAVAASTATPLGIYEGKTTSAIRHSLDWGDEPPDRVIAQVQHNLAASQAERAWVTCLVGGQKLRIYEIERDDDLIRELIALEAYFWEQHVLAGEPPPVVGTEHEGDVLRAAYRNSDPRKSVDLPEHALDLVRDRQAAKTDEKSAKERAQLAENSLMVLLGEAESGLIRGREVVTFRRVERKDVDRERLMHAHPNLYDRFTKVTAFRRFWVSTTALEEIE